MQITILPGLVLKSTNNMIFKFLWSKGNTNENRITECVKRDIMIQSYENQGLNMIDIYTLQVAFAFKWIQKLNDDTLSYWHYIPVYYFNMLSPNLTIFKCNIDNFRTVRGITPSFPSIYKELLGIWFKHAEKEQVSPANSAQYCGTTMYLNIKTLFYSVRNSYNMELHFYLIIVTTTVKQTIINFYNSLQIIL